MSQSLDLAVWPRRPHFELFRTYDNPYVNICADVDVTRLRALAKDSSDVSFFLSSIYLSLRVANETESFRLRVRGDRVLVHEQIHAGSTILMDDHTFGFVYFDFIEQYRKFQVEARREMEACKDSRDALNPRDDRDDLIHYSVIPWISFSSFSHARRWNREDSIPKIVFGKFREEGSRLTMPVSVEVHHGLMDGFHIGEFFSRFEAYLKQPESALGLSSK